MTEKEKQFESLSKEVQKCMVCTKVMFSPHLEGSNCLVHDEKNEKQTYVNRWNLWQGSLNAEIMVIGQDYGVSDGKFATDKSLADLFQNSFDIDINKRDERLFFTNIANCYRKTKSTGKFNKGCLALCAHKYIGRLIKIVSPKIIIVLGQDAFEALVFCDKAELICENLSIGSKNDNYANVINHNYSLVFEDGLKVAVFPVYHPGVMGQRNRNAKEQLADWKRIACFYEKNKSGDKTNDMHFVYHHNMFGPSCEIASLNNEEDFRIYCYRRHKVCKPDCEKCQYFEHGEMGKGVCCKWEESYSQVKTDDHVVQYGEACKELRRVNEIKNRKSALKEENDHVIVECEVAVYKNKKYIMLLESGMNAVIKFANLADKGIDSAEHTKSSFYCNRDVTISGNNLISFIKKEYPERLHDAELNIQNGDEIYIISSVDLS